MDQLVYGPFISRKQAQAQGLKIYFTGKPCKHGHIAVRVHGGNCLECKRIEWTKRNNRLSQDPEHQAVMRANANRWRTNNKKEHSRRNSEYDKKRREIDDGYRIMRNLRSRLFNALRDAMAQKSASTLELLGIEPAGLLKHLESLFLPGMSWDNRSEWHVDHIRPCASFDLTDPEQQRECFHYTNLQPLWAADNIRKSDIWEPNEATA